MKINRYLFPIILLGVFITIIALGIISGAWQTNGGGRRGQSTLPTAPTVETV